jgi:N-acetylglucosamine-6-phosphate deacetylase
VGALVVDPEGDAPERATLLVEGGRIEGRLPAEEAPGPDWRRVLLDGRVVAPGFVDLHFHGALFSAPPERFSRVLADAAGGMLRGGATAFLATSVAWSPDELAVRVERLAQAVDDLSVGGAGCLGLHLEGPWISPEAPGALAAENLRAFDPARDVEVLDSAGGLLRMVTLAPELPGSERLLAELRERGAVAALGHTRASPAEIREGIAGGLAHVTHLFNAMGPMHHREPGVPGTVLASDELSCDLICDGHHVDPAMVRVAAKALHDRLMLITDRVELPEAAGEPSEGEPVRLRDGTLAGSRLTLDRALRCLREFAGTDLREAVAACTSRPARLLGVEAHHGTLRRGARADLAVLDAEGRVVETWLGGRPAWRAEA